MTLVIFTLRTIGIKLLEKNIFNGKGKSRKKPRTMTPQLWKKEFEKIHGRQLFLVMFKFVTCIIFIFSLIRNSIPWMLLKGFHVDIP